MDGHEVGKVSVTKGLSEKAIRNMLKNRIQALNACYWKALKKQPSLKGKVVFKLVIDSVGRVTTVHPEKRIQNADEWEHCMLQKLKKFHFSSPKGSKKGIIIVTFILK